MGCLQVKNIDENIPRVVAEARRLFKDVAFGHLVSFLFLDMLSNEENVVWLEKFKKKCRTIEQSRLNSCDLRNMRLSIRPKPKNLVCKYVLYVP